MNHSLLYSYAYLRMSYERTSQSPVDLMLPLAVRAIAALKDEIVVASSLQEEISAIWGLNVPQNVVRFMMPSLETQGHLVRSSNVYRKTFKQPDSVFLDEERKATELYRRVQMAIKRLLIVHGIQNDLNPDEVIERFLDSGGTALFPTSARIPYNDPLDSKSNLIIGEYLGLTSRPSRPENRDDLESLVIGDMLYKAIASLSESDIGPLSGGKMEDTEVYLDTPVLMRVMGYETADLCRPIQEMMQLAIATGCKLRAFRHTADEVKGVLVSAANNVRPENRKSQLDRLILAKGIDRSDILEDAEFLDQVLDEKDIAVVDSPPFDETLGLDELRLDTYLQSKIGYQNKEAKIRDIASLTSIYRLRGGEQRQHLERCTAIFITTNLNLATASTSFFNPYLKEMGRANVVQHCMTDVIFTMRLWLKVPSQFKSVPRSQIIAHTLATLRPHDALYDAFIRQLDKLVERGLIDNEDAVRARLAALVSPTLMVETSGHVSAIDEGSTSRIVDRILSQEEDLRRQEVERAQVAERDRSARKIQELEKEHGAAIKLLQEQSELDKAAHDAALTGSQQALEQLRSNVEILKASAAKTQASRDRLITLIASTVTIAVKCLTILTIVGLITLTVLDICENCQRSPLVERYISPEYVRASLGLLATLLAVLAFWGVDRIKIIKESEKRTRDYVAGILSKVLNV